MTDRIQYHERDLRHHTLKLKQMLNDTATHAREDVSKVSDLERSETKSTPASAYSRLRIL
jgi:hypothetical protein